jgi:hypothetical protein
VNRYLWSSVVWGSLILVTIGAWGVLEELGIASEEGRSSVPWGSMSGWFWWLQQGRPWVTWTLLTLFLIGGALILGHIFWHGGWPGIVASLRSRLGL